MLRMTALENMVDELPDHLQREILRLRYMDAESETTCRLKRWNAIAIKLYGSDDRKYIEAVLRIHRKALENIEIPIFSQNSHTK